MQNAMKNTLPSSLNEWLNFLKNKRFPVKANNLSRLKIQLRKAEGTLDSMQANIASDPLMAFAILNEANRVVSNNNSEIKTPIHAAAMLGLNGIERSLSQFEAYDVSTKPPEYLIAFLSQIQTSYEAASMAKYWAIEKLSSHEEDIFWITLFRDAPRWLLWYYAYPTMNAIEQRIAQGEKAKSVELDILGCRIGEIIKNLCIYWNTSSKILDSLSAKHIPSAQEMQSLAHLAHHPEELPHFTEDKRLTILTNTPLIFSYCASKVAQEANKNGWDSKNLPFFYRVVATVMHRYLGDVVQIAHLSSIEAVNLYNIHGRTPLAKQLLDPTLYTKHSSNKKSIVKISPIEALKQARDNQKNLDTKGKASLALKAIKHAIPNTQHCILFKQANNHTAPLFQFGYNVETLKAIQWNAPSGVFKKLASKQMANHLFGQSLKNLLMHLPGTSEQIIDNNSHMILASTVTATNEMLIFWLETRDEFNDKDYKTLKQIVSLTSHKASISMNNYQDRLRE